MNFAISGDSSTGRVSAASPGGDTERNTIKHTSKLVKSYIVLALGFLLLAGIPAVAAPIDPAITVTGSVTYDTGYSFVDNASQSGAMTRTIGGSTTTTTYSASSPGV
ncbi:MAG: hypothetical protein HN350_21190, partial [Phycisphaerales bacterium]|nr:hypothetical protein [Phycisphaerales bacterium]